MLKRTQISAALLAAFGMAAGVQAQQQPPAQPSQQLERVEVTGSSIKRIEGETALPVQVITREDIQRTGAVTVEQLMQTISANSSSQTLVAASASGATTLGLSGISLRGLSSLRTLVLVNGRRVSPYGYGFTNDSVSVDVNSIPVSAIERIEVLKDGASAVYGSDAIAGVVNFILRKDYRGLEATAEYGAARQNTGSVARGSLAYGFGDLGADRFNVMVTLNVQREKGLFGRDRKFASSGINVDAFNDTSSGNTFPANVTAVDGSAGGNPSFPTCPGPYSTRSGLFDLFGIETCRFDPSPMVSLLPDTERVGLFTGVRFALTPHTELFAEASFSKNKQTTEIQPTPISDQFTLPLNNPLANQFPYNAFTGGEPSVGGLPYSTILLTSASPFYPTAFITGQTGGATPDLLVRWRASLIGNRSFTDTSQAPRLTFGVRGDVAGWDYDSAFLYSQSKVTERLNNGFAAYSRILPILNSGNVDFFGSGTSAATLAQIDATKVFGDVLKTETSLMSVSGKASRELTTLPGGPMALAVGAEFRRENYKLDPAQSLIEGDLTGYGGNFAPVDRSRNVYGLFTELNVPIIRKLELNAAVRYDDYANVGSKASPKLGLRWAPMSELLLRASAGKGFRAPSLLDLFAPATTGVSPPGLNDPIRCPVTGSSLDCATQFPVTNGGNPNLKAESSTNITFGIVLEPTNNISLSADYFNIKLKDTINNGIPAATILGDLTRYGSLVRRGPSTDPALPGPIIDIDQTNLNLGQTKLAGVDLEGKWQGSSTPYGKFGFQLSGTYFSKWDAQNPDGSFSNQLDTANSSTGGVIVRWRHYATLSWTAGNLTASLSQNYQKGYNDLPGTFEDPSDPAFVPRRVAVYRVYDFQTVYRATAGLTLTLGVRNLLDTEPPYTNAGGQTSFQAGYDPTYVDPRGRFVYGRVAYKFM